MQINKNLDSLKSWLSENVTGHPYRKLNIDNRKEQPVENLCTH